jgi:hypothetical protein
MRNLFILFISFALSLTIYGFHDVTSETGSKVQFGDLPYPGEDVTKLIMKGKWRYIDTTGEMIIEPGFDWAWDFPEGLAAVMLRD